MDGRNWLTIEETARLLGCTANHLTKLVDSYHCPVIGDGADAVDVWSEEDLLLTTPLSVVYPVVRQPIHPALSRMARTCYYEPTTMP